MGEGAWRARVHRGSRATQAKDERRRARAHLRRRRRPLGQSEGSRKKLPLIRTAPFQRCIPKLESGCLCQQPAASPRTRLNASGPNRADCSTVCTIATGMSF